MSTNEHSTGSVTSDDRFEVGEIAIVHSPGSWTHGREALLLAGPFYGPVFSNQSGKITVCHHFDVEIDGRRIGSSGNTLSKPITQLRKKRPPREDLQVVRWAECPWQPEQVRV